MGNSLFSQKMWESRLKVKRNSYFPENPFGNCQLPAEVLLTLAFIRSELNVGNFVTIWAVQLQSSINEKYM